MSQRKHRKLSAKAWLEQQFECEFCEECGGDVCHHTAVPFMGNWFARCDFPRDDDGLMHPTVEKFRAEYRS